MWRPPSLSPWRISCTRALKRSRNASPTTSRGWSRPQREPAGFAQRWASTTLDSSASLSIDYLEPQSRQLLQQSRPSRTQLEALIEQWSEALLTLSADPLLQQAALERMDDLYQIWKASNPKSSRPFALVLEAWSRTPTADGHRALAVLEAWNRQFLGDLELAPTRKAYHAVLRAFAADKDGDASIAGCVAAEILTQLEEWDFTMAPNRETYQLAARCLVKSLLEQQTDDPELLVNFEQVMDELLSMTISQGGAIVDDFTHQDALSLVDLLCEGLIVAEHRSVDWKKWYSALQAILGDEGYREGLLRTAKYSQELAHRLSAATVAVQRVSLRTLQGNECGRTAEGLFESLQRLFPYQLPNVYHYHMALKAWSTAPNSIEAQDARRRLLDDMEGAHKRTIALERISSTDVTESWNRLMMAHYEAGNSARVQEIWREMSSSPGVRRNNLSFSTILKALADVGNSPAATQAHGILKRMIAKPRCERFVQLDAQHFGSVMVAWSRSRHPKAGEFCQEVFDRMRQEAIEDASLAPSVVHYSALIASWGWHKDERSVKRVLSLFHEMKEAGIEPDLQSYVALLTSLSRAESLEGARYAQQVLDQLELQFACSSASESFVQRQCYVSVMYAWANSSSPAAPEKCEGVLRQLESAFLAADRDPSLLPNSSAYRALIDAWMKNGPRQAGERANGILEQAQAAAKQGMAESPDNRLFTAVMAAHWKSGDRNAASKIEGTLKVMRDAYESGNMAAKPDAKALTILLHAYAISDMDDKAAVAWRQLQEMCDAYEQGDVDMRPTSHSFAAVLNACAFTRTDVSALREKAVQIALTVMNTLDEGTYDHPNEFTYRNLFQVFGRQIDNMKERTRIAGIIFHRCCQEGHVNSWIIKEIRESVPELYAKLPFDAKKRPQLPAQWTRRSKEARPTRCTLT